ncbi:MAG: hypothetical protein JW745_00390 [Sedimentisphaerales bacterium]|nr:hypothetical protein [Sedimentisphaerales bacterium]MBN2844326.1 hypothetical protein [Sedimentisphaerales bacterium]
MDNRQDNISLTLTHGPWADILDELQVGLPICDQPFDALAHKTGLDQSEVFDIVNNLCQTGIIREITPVFNAKKLNYASTLIAATVAQDQLDNIVSLLNSLPGVSHNYARNHELNLWFTLALPLKNAIDGDVFHPFLLQLQNQFNLATIMSLPALKMFKLKVLFGKKAPAPARQVIAPHFGNLPSAPAPAISAADKQLICELQKGIPLVPRPFDLIASVLANKPEPVSITGPQIVEKLQIWQQQGVMRRLSARVRHYHLGFVHNAMLVFALPDDYTITQVGQKLASYDFVSHCYQRRRNNRWNYDLYAMVHASSATELNNNINSLINEAPASQHQILNTAHEYKKSSVLYFQ